jgi:hypothetical protein
MSASPFAGMCAPRPPLPVLGAPSLPVAPPLPVLGVPPEPLAALCPPLPGAAPFMFVAGMSPCLSLLEHASVHAHATDAAIVFQSQRRMRPF